MQEGHPAYLEGGGDAVSALTGVRWAKQMPCNHLQQRTALDQRIIHAHQCSAIGRSIGSSVGARR
jgi:hypothetical protein